MTSSSSILKFVFLVVAVSSSLAAATRICKTRVFLYADQRYLKSDEQIQAFQNFFLNSLMNANSLLEEQFNISMRPTVISLKQSNTSTSSSIINDNSSNNYFPLNYEVAASNEGEAKKGGAELMQKLLTSFDSEMRRLKSDPVCANLLVTSQDFNGTMGLAYLSEKGSQNGGLCGRNYNSAVISYINHGRRIGTSQFNAVLIHEILHMMGAAHDDDTECEGYQKPQGSQLMNSNVRDQNEFLFQLSECAKSKIIEREENWSRCLLKE